ncbi:MAG TPA: hypothetical protein VF771_21275, partial [Longimicrobiaceae bacterium]
SGGVWRFMQRVAQWIANPRRQGMGEEIIPLDHLLPPPADERRAEPAPAEAKQEAGSRPKARADGAAEPQPNGGARRNGKRPRGGDEHEHHRHAGHAERRDGTRGHGNGRRPQREEPAIHDLPEAEPQEASPAVAEAQQAA